MIDHPGRLALEGIENFVVLNTALTVGVFFAIACLRPCAWFRGLHPLVLSRVYAGAILSPFLFSGWLILASLLPVFWMGENPWRIAHADPHTLHLVNALTFPVDPLLQYLSAVFLIAAAGAVSLAAARAYFRLSALVRCLEIGDDPVPNDRIGQVRDFGTHQGIPVGLVYSRRPVAFVWGIFTVKLIVSTGLLQALSKEKLAALLEHEAAHYRRRDNLTRWVLNLSRYASFAFPLATLLYHWWHQAVEMVCDEAAARRTDPCDVAAALVAVKRLAGDEGGLVPGGQSGFTGGAGAGIEARVRHLLTLPGGGSRPGLERDWAFGVPLTLAGFGLALIWVLLFAPLSVHRFLEMLFH
jgi:Zn-dependent protease with chaperone function